MNAGIILEYEQGGLLKTKSIDLLDLKPEYVQHCFDFLEIILNQIKN